MDRTARHWLYAAATALIFAAAPDCRATNIDTVLAQCADCHEKYGSSADPDVPIIGGLSAAYIEENLGAYRTKDRPCPRAEFRSGSRKGTKTTMCEVVKDLDASDLKQLADHFSKLRFAPAAQAADASLAARGKAVFKQSCEKCHSEGGTVADDDAGILAGQWIPYMKSQMSEVKSGARKTDKKNKMKQVLDDLDAPQIDAVLNYLASQK